MILFAYGTAMDLHSWQCKFADKLDSWKHRAFCFVSHELRIQHTDTNRMFSSFVGQGAAVIVMSPAPVIPCLLVRTTKPALQGSVVSTAPTMWPPWSNSMLASLPVSTRWEMTLDWQMKVTQWKWSRWNHRMCGEITAINNSVIIKKYHSKTTSAWIAIIRHPFSRKVA